MSITLKTWGKAILVVVFGSLLTGFITGFISGLGYPNAADHVDSLLTFLGGSIVGVIFWEGQE